MENEYIIQVKDVHIKYKTVQAESIKKSLFSLRKSRMEEFEAVKGVSFNLKKGEIVGLIGRNGSGKSTMLRSIAGIFTPDEGTIDIGDHSISLLSIGVGFQKELTGKENIYLSGLLLGFTEAQIKEKYDEIVAFSGLGKFINSPVSTYSSGMYSKLAFSITAVLETEIMLIDEVLSVGDIAFKKKSFAKMRELISDNERTVMIVSHSIETVRKLCSRVIWLHDGLIRMDGPTEEVLEQYQIFMDELEPNKKKTKQEKQEEKMLAAMLDDEA
ncbi:MAG: ABC transporter ATP-binding protein [Firmicutes bacterium]|nr:ABC transporter ATP-binding protein [Bacillota bacterium]MDD6695404.1 ABC transporter ATP-binding protein [Bacillota bacterium]MDY3769442.1 ABC transporter ATP-binding protein [Lachnospiraceae bacterium]